ncbi:MAG: RluA family pseudouridine synthase [Chloroflexota bacterium]
MAQIEEIKIIFEDENFLAVYKPANILTIPDRFDREAPNLSAILNRERGKVYVVHRLDRETSGILLFAKTAEAHKNLNTQFQERKVQRIYHAALRGKPPRDYMEIDIPLAPSIKRKGTVMPSVRGKESLTILTVLEKFRSASLVECNLITGRQHQLRVHVAAVGAPLLVDEIYGSDSQFFLSSIKRKYNIPKGEIEKPLISRITMHAYSLKFESPSTGEPLELSANYPKDFEILLKNLRKYSAI